MSWNQAVQQHRKQKDKFFRTHPRSPIPQEIEDEFDGLRYFDPSEDYRFEVTLEEYDEKERITVETTQDGKQTYTVYGEFNVTIQGQEVTLQAYRQDNGEGFWVPFRDETNGDETYEAGRYIDLEPDEDRLNDGSWVLDFNMAYNPFCAYSERYECPLVPMANWLDVRIPAGEKTFEH